MNSLKTLMFVACIAATGTASAGIPVADAIQLSQTIAVSMAEQAMHEALAQARNQLSEELAAKGITVDRELSKQAEDFAWDMYEKTTVKNGYGWNFDVGSAEFYKHMQTYTDEAVKNKDAESFEESMAKYKDGVDDEYREANGMQSNQEHIQTAMDKDLTYKVMVDKTLAETNKRQKTIEELRVKADAAKTPQEKEDLQIAIAIEQNAVNNEALRMRLAADAKEVERKTEMHRISNAVTEKHKAISFKID